MTEIKKYTENEKEELKEVLIKNLPNRIKGGNHKKKSNVLEYQTIIALNKCKFINLNTKEMHITENLNSVSRNTWTLFVRIFSEL